MKGANVRASVRITFEEAVFGCEKELDLNLKENCNNMSRNRRKAGNFSGNLSEMPRGRPGGIHPAVHVRHGEKCTDLSGVSRNR